MTIWTTDNHLTLRLAKASMIRTMDEYGAIVKKIAEETGVLFIDTQAAFNEVLKKLYAATLAWDRVHRHKRVMSFSREQT